MKNGSIELKISKPRHKKYNICNICQALLILNGFFGCTCSICIHTDKQLYFHQMDMAVISKRKCLKASIREGLKELLCGLFSLTVITYFSISHILFYFICFSTAPIPEVPLQEIKQSRNGLIVSLHNLEPL